MSERGFSEAFQDVDRSDFDLLISFLEDVDRLPSFQACWTKQLEILELRAGSRVLDVGCGIGDRAAHMAVQVGVDGAVVGTDLSEVMVDTSKKRHGSSGLSINFQVAPAESQPFEDGTFDAVRTERVLMYVPDPMAAFREFARLLKPRGRLVAVDFDWDALVFFHPDKDLNRRVIRYIANSFPNGKVATHFPRLFRESGFKKVTMHPFGYVAPLEIVRRICGSILAAGVAEGAFTEDEIGGWWSELESADREGHCLFSFTGFIGGGVKA